MSGLMCSSIGSSCVVLVGSHYLEDLECEEFNDANNVVDLNKLLFFDVGPVYLKLMKADKDKKLYGFLPLMASCGFGQIGALNAESHEERVISVSNCVLHPGNTSMNEFTIEMLVLLKMNRDFMEHMRTYYRLEIEEHYRAIFESRKNPKDSDRYTVYKDPIVRDDGVTGAINDNNADEDAEEDEEEDGNGSDNNQLEGDYFTGDLLDDFCGVANEEEGDESDDDL